MMFRGTSSNSICRTPPSQHGERLDMAAHEVGEGGVEVEAQERIARVAQHQDERHQGALCPSDGQFAEVRPVGPGPARRATGARWEPSGPCSRPAPFATQGMSTEPLRSISPCAKVATTQPMRCATPEAHDDVDRRRDRRRESKAVPYLDPRDGAGEETPVPRMGHLGMVAERVGEEPLRTETLGGHVGMGGGLP